MAGFTEYRNMAPVTVDGLLDLSNTILRTGGGTLVSKRTVRYYTSEGIMPPPIGSPKYARYRFEHLCCLVGARVLQDAGMKLEQIKVELGEVRRSQTGKIERRIDEWLSRPRLHETKQAFSGNKARRIQLGDNLELAIYGHSDDSDALKEAATLIKRMLA